MVRLLHHKHILSSQTESIQCEFNGRKLTVLVQVRSHNGERFRRPRRIDLESKATDATITTFGDSTNQAGSHAAVELALTVAEEAVVVAQTEAEVDEVAEHPSRTQMVRAKENTDVSTPTVESTAWDTPATDESSQLGFLTC